MAASCGRIFRVLNNISISQTSFNLSGRIRSSYSKRCTLQQINRTSPSLLVEGQRRCMTTLQADDKNIPHEHPQKDIQGGDQEVLKLEIDTTEDEDIPDVLYSHLCIEVKGHDIAVLDSYEKFVQLASKCLGLTGYSVKRPKYDVLRRSPSEVCTHFQKHYVQYEQRTYYRVFNFTRTTGSTADTFLEYIQRNLPEGVAMKVTKVS
ncbi:28S ribosomal protein S10, mitochondrial-like [Dreissena polymorpha]|uniref:28S ribosomal protein S10, mitochondrial-like n=1 Tax=Dreissena polymorpha TaxID=45954 RepID=UPI0022650958|nr:28S ribosomal protein S10, mitochondrial-like [Dreissena polymorpha]